MPRQNMGNIKIVVGIPLYLLVYYSYASPLGDTAPRRPSKQRETTWFISECFSLLGFFAIFFSEKNIMVHDYLACPRKTQLNIWEWRVYASQGHVDFWFQISTHTGSIMNSFYPENILQSIGDFDHVVGQNEAQEDKDLYFLHQQRLFVLKRDGQVVEYNPKLLQFQQNDVDLCNILFSTLSTKSEYKEELTAYLKPHFDSILTKVIDGASFSMLVDETLLVRQEALWSSDIWMHLYNNIPRRKDDEEIKVDSSGEGFNTVLKGFYTIRTWPSWSEFRKAPNALTANALTAFDFQFIPNVWHGTGFFLDPYVPDRSNGEQCKWYLSTLCDTTKSFLPNALEYHFKVRSRDLECELMVKPKQTIEITTTLD